jgi:hypothetical protein
MRKRALAPCLSNRFKQYLTHITESPNIKWIDKKQIIEEFPPSMMFLIAFQFEQNKKRIWNLFTLIACQFALVHFYKW